MPGKLQGTMCALRPCVSCGENTWVLDSDGTCPDCGGRSKPTITQAEIDADAQKATAMLGVLLPAEIDTEARPDAFFAAFNDAKKRWARYNAFARYHVNLLEYGRVCTAYASVGRLLLAKLEEYYGKK